MEIWWFAYQLYNKSQYEIKININNLNIGFRELEQIWFDFFLVTEHWKFIKECIDRYTFYKQWVLMFLNRVSKAGWSQLIFSESSYSYITEQVWEQQS